MNNTHLTFLFFGFVFLFLYFVPFMPRGKQIALVYLRYLVLASIAALILAPFFWLICSAFKDPEVLRLTLSYLQLQNGQARPSTLAT